MNHQSHQKPFSGPPPQVIVILKEEVGPVISKMRSVSMDSGAPEAELQQTLSANGLELLPVFGETESDVASFVARAEKAAARSRGRYCWPDLLNYPASFRLP